MARRFATAAAAAAASPASVSAASFSQKSQQTPVQSATCSLLDPGRNSDLRGPGDRKLPDLDDGDNELVGLGLVGS